MLPILDSFYKKKFAWAFEKVAQMAKFWPFWPHWISETVSNGLEDLLVDIVARLKSLSDALVR